MHLTRWLSMVCAGWVMAASAAHALTLGPPPTRMALGRPLNVFWPVRLDAGEALDPECVSAELMFGDKPVPQHRMRWSIEPGRAPNERLIRVVSLGVIDEPVVTLQVSAGCSGRVTRRFTAIAESPLSAVGSAQGSDQPSQAGAETASTAAQVPAPASPQAQAAAASARAASVEGFGAPQMRVPARPQRSTAQSLRAASAASAAPSAARLSLESPEVGALQRALSAALAEHRAISGREAAQEAAQSAESASAAAASARAAAERMQALEERVTRLLAENQQQREQMQQLRQRVSRGEAAGRAMPWLLLALLLCLGTAAWLAMKLRRQQREAQSKWWADAADVLSDVRPDPVPSQPQALAAAPAGTTATLLAGDADAFAAAPKPHAWPPAAPVVAEEPPAASPKDPGPPSSITSPDTALNPVSVQHDSPNTNPLPRALSIEELIDLEQQADFFIVLGQDDSAIDLLMSHLRDTGGTSPLPYLKLLEIYRRRNDREAHDRIRGRFNLRFNAYAPAWDTDMLQGRTLIDYPQVTKRLQGAWSSPIDAMAELETLMFRKDGGELFELPAYREVLMLYSLARELMDYQVGLRVDVDVLLPLSIDDSERMDWAELSPAGPEESAGAAPAPVPDASLVEPAGPPGVDLDLDLPAEALPPIGRRGRPS